jgi:hypothetical protein
MMQHFPIFVDLHVVPPVIIGDAPALAAQAAIKGRPLLILDCEDVSLNRFLVATARVIADQTDYLRRCGFTHAAIKPADHPYWQQAHQAIRNHFQHMPDSRGRGAIDQPRYRQFCRHRNGQFCQEFFSRIFWYVP